MMNLAIFPNWNSLDSVRHAHSELEVAGLVFFALLVLMEALAHNSQDEQKRHRFDSIGIWFFAIAIFCEIGAYLYGQRNDELSQQVIVSLDIEAKDAFTSASNALTKAGEAENRSGTALSKGDEALGKVIAAKNAADRAKGEADVVLAEAERLRQQVVALSPRTLTTEQQSQIAKELKRVRGSHPTVIESYGMDGEGTALATQLIGTFEATGGGTPGDGRADKIVSGGFEWGISIRGPEYEMRYMTVLRDALVKIGKLEQVSVNGPVSVAGSQLSGRAAISGVAQIGGGSWKPIQEPPPTTGPVYVLVGIRPPPVLQISGKQK